MFDVRIKKYVVGLATSADGFRWEKRGPIFEGRDQDRGFDSMGAAARCVVRDLDTKQYFMFYEGVDRETGLRSIGPAVAEQFDKVVTMRNQVSACSAAPGGAED